MSSTPFTTRAYDLGLKAVSNFKTLPDDVIEYYEQHLDQIPRALARGFVQDLLFSVVATTSLDAVAGKETNRCFTGKRYAYRDKDLSHWLPKDQPDADVCVISTLALGKENWTFREAATTILNIDVNTGTEIIGKLLIQYGYTMTLPQVEEMGKADGAKMRGIGNFFFVRTKGANDPVAVGSIYESPNSERTPSRERTANTNINRLSHAHRWNADCRLLIRNLKDSSKLC